MHERAHFCAKPGGTAGVKVSYALVPAEVFVWDEGFFVIKNSFRTAMAVCITAERPMGGAAGSDTAASTWGH